jgi:hypothetical protein
MLEGDGGDWANTVVLGIQPIPITNMKTDKTRKAFSANFIFIVPSRNLNK